MKAYIITTPNNHGRQADLSNYPKALPTPELYYGVTPDTIEVPEWWLQIYKGKWLNDIPERVYCCGKSKELLLRSHKEKYPDEDALIMEDDIIYTDNADEKYNRFMADLPDNWHILYLGGYHEFNSRGAAPMEVKPGILRCLNVLGTEALIVRSSFLDTTIEQLTHSPDNVYGHCDWQLVPLQRTYCCYAPLGFIAGQQDGFSELFQKERKVGFRNDFMYVGIDRKTYIHGHIEHNCTDCNGKCNCRK
ncbi:MAG: hypothetical protein IJG38_04950 [Thermoguttaceae bacterium]|nr:hypothetical protein [Thermoguttaceae bacterium]